MAPAPYPYRENSVLSKKRVQKQYYNHRGIVYYYYYYYYYCSSRALTSSTHQTISREHTRVDKSQALQRLPHLASPAALAMADSGGKWKCPPHLRAINDALVRAWATPNSRLAVSVPFQHGKTVLCSNYFPAWVLLLWPETRIALASYSDEYAAKQGAAVRDIVARYGPALGVSLREDTRAKDEWVVDFTGGGQERNNWLAGGMVCKGRGGALTGRAADLLILDDMIKNSEEAQSPAVLDGLWDWYCTVAFSRLGPTAPVISVSTRWGPKDLVGRWESEAKVGGEQFEHVVFPAIAGWRCK